MINTKVDALQGETTYSFEEVSLKLDNVVEEIAKIGQVTNYDQYYSNLQSLKN